MFHNQPSYLGGDIGSDEQLAITYHLAKAKNDSFTKLGKDSFLEAQGEFYNGGKIAQNRFLVGPLDDKDAYYIISWLAAIAARGVNQNQRQSLIELSESYYSDGTWTTPYNIFSDNRKQILIDGITKISNELSSTNSKDTYSVAVGSELAKNSSLSWNDREKQTLDYLYEQALSTAEEGARLAKKVVETVESGLDAAKAAGDFVGKLDEKERKFREKIQQIKRVTAYVGLFGTLAYVFYRIQRVRK
jgi:hypothetical protein